MGMVMPMMDCKTWVHFPFSVRSLVALSRAETQHLRGEDLNPAVPRLLTVSVTTQVSTPSVMYTTFPSSSPLNQEASRIKPVDNFRGVDRICCKSAPWSIDTHPLCGKHSNGVDCAVYLSMADMRLQNRNPLR